MKINLYNIFILKCISITNILVQNITWRVLLDNNKKQNKQKTKNRHSLKDYIE